MNILENIFSWRVPSIDYNNGFSWFYFLFLILTVIISLLIIFKTKNHSDERVRLVVFGFGILFLCLELFKQLFHNVFDGGDGYEWNIFPFQLCSTPLYFCLLSVLFPKNIRTKIYSYLTYVGFLGGIAVALFPDTVSSDEVLMYADTLIWHNSMILLSIYLIVTQGFGNSLKETYPAMFCFLVVALMAMGMNYIFEICKQNDIVDGTFNMFMISPYYDCNSPIISDILNMSNWYVVWMFYFGGVILGIITYWGIIHCILKLTRRKEMSEA